MRATDIQLFRAFDQATGRAVEPAGVNVPVPFPGLFVFIVETVIEYGPDEVGWHKVGGIVAMPGRPFLTDVRPVNLNTVDLPPGEDRYRVVTTAVSQSPPVGVARSTLVEVILIADGVEIGRSDTVRLVVEPRFG